MDKARFVQLQVQMQDAFARLSDAIYEMARAETYEWAMTKVLAAVFSSNQRLHRGNFKLRNP